jgi:YVTN family beta-propeller protein
MLATAGISHGQWSAKTVRLADSAGPVARVSCLALDVTGRTLYAASHDGWVFAIDPDAQHVKARVAVEADVRSLLLDEAGHKLYCAGTGSVHIVDTRSLKAMEVRVGTGRLRLALNPGTNKVYCASEADNSVVVLSGLTGGVIRTIPAGESPSAICCNPAGNRVYCANQNSNDVTIIDGIGDSVVRTVLVERGPQVLVWNPGSNKVFCVNYHSDNISVIDCPGDTVQPQTLAAGHFPSAIAVDPVSGLVYCASRSGDLVTVLSPQANSVVASVPVGSGPMALACDPGTGRIFCLCPGDSTVAVLERDSLRPIGSLRVSGAPLAIVVDTRSGRAFCADGDGGELTVIERRQDSVRTPALPGSKPIEPKELSQSVPQNDRPHRMCLDPAASRLFVAMTTRPELADVDTELDTATFFVRTGGGCGGMLQPGEQSHLLRVPGRKPGRRGRRQQRCRRRQSPHAGQAADSGVQPGEQSRLLRHALPGQRGGHRLRH